MTLDRLRPGHVGQLVSLAQEHETAKVQLVGVLTSYELQSIDGAVVYAWLFIGGRAHTFSNLAEVQRATLEVVE